MRKNSILALSILTLMLATLVVPAYAAKYTANGIVTQYQGGDSPPSAEVVSGDWNLQVTGKKVDFKLSYTERNLISESEGDAPVGSIDLFEITFIGKDKLHNPWWVIEEAGTWVITGDFHISKLATQPDGSQLWIPDYLGPKHGGAVHIYPDGSLALDVDLWHLLGLSARDNTYSAQGELTAYKNAWTSRIVTGTWSVTVIDNQVFDFNYNYVEENLVEGEPEYSPVGSKDIFWSNLLTSSNTVIDDKVLTFDCTAKCTKLWSKMDGGKEWVTWDSATWHVTVNPDGITIEKPENWGQDWTTLGTTTKINVK